MFLIFHFLMLFYFSIFLSSLHSGKSKVTRGSVAAVQKRLQTWSGISPDWPPSSALGVIQTSLTVDAFSFPGDCQAPPYVVHVCWERWRLPLLPGPAFRGTPHPLFMKSALSTPCTPTPACVSEQAQTRRQHRPAPCQDRERLENMKIVAMRRPVSPPLR